MQAISWSVTTHISNTGVCTLSDVLVARFSRYSWMISGLPSTTVDFPNIRKWMMSPSIEGNTVNYRGMCIKDMQAHHTEQRAHENQATPYHPAC